MPGVSEPKFLFLGEPAWRAAPVDPLWAGPEGRLQLLPRPAPVAGESPGAESVAAAITSAPGGRLFWTDPVAGAIWVEQGATATPLPSVAATGRFIDPAGICAGPQGALFVADRGRNQIQVYALDHYQLIDVWDGFAAPCSLAASPDGRRIYVADKSGVTALDAHTGRRLAQVGADRLLSPRSLCTTADGRLFVADPGLYDGAGGVAVFAGDGSESFRFPTGADDPPAAVAVGRNFIWVGSETGGGIRQFTRSGAPAGRSTYYIGPVHHLHYVPERDLLLVANRAAGPLPLAPAGAFATRGEWISEPLDSTLYDCQWHKLVLGARVPYGTRLTVETRSAPVPLAAGELAGDDWSQPVLFTGEAGGDLDMAVFSQAGRYLWLRLTLEGDGTATPELTRIQVYYPRSTYADYLPAVFRSDPVSADFLDRLMLLYEHFLGRWEDQADNLADLFSPEASPYVSALASWLDFGLNGRLPEAEQRQWLARAMELNHRRGTVEGLRDLLRQYTDPAKPPVVVEGFTRRGFTRLGESGEGAQLGVDTVLPAAPEAELVLGADPLGGGDLLQTGGLPAATGAYQFTVFAYQYPGQPADELSLLDRVIGAERPANTLHMLCEVRPAMRVGAQSIIGVDTVLAGPYPLAVAGDAAGAARALPGAGQMAPPPALPTELQRRSPVLNLGNRLR